MCIPLCTGNSHSLGPESSCLMESFLTTGYMHPTFATLLFTHILVIWISSRTSRSRRWRWRWRWWVGREKGENGEDAILVLSHDSEHLWEVSVLKGYPYVALVSSSVFSVSKPYWCFRVFWSQHNFSHLHSTLFCV